MNGSRFHIEINSIKFDDMAVRFNIFGDTLAQVTSDLEQVIAYVTGQAVAARADEFIRSTQAAFTKVAGAGPVSVAPKVSAPPAAKGGACIGCGSVALEWVTGNRKDNGKPFGAYKCQDCGKWLPAVKK